jgi:hypothetical protein
LVKARHCINYGGHGRIRNPSTCTQQQYSPKVHSGEVLPVTTKRCRQSLRVHTSPSHRREFFIFFSVLCAFGEAPFREPPDYLREGPLRSRSAENWRKCWSALTQADMFFSPVFNRRQQTPCRTKPASAKRSLWMHMHLRTYVSLTLNRNRNLLKEENT